MNGWSSNFTGGGPFYWTDAEIAAIGEAAALPEAQREERITESFESVTRRWEATGVADALISIGATRKAGTS